MTDLAVPLTPSGPPRFGPARVLPGGICLGFRAAQYFLILGKRAVIFPVLLQAIPLLSR